MFSLVYKSVAKTSFKLPEIQEMLEKAREYNKLQEITGCLLFHEGHFIQYLEGNQIKVLRLFDKIKMDKRHSEVTLLSYGEVDGREFEKWYMAFENLNGGKDQMAYLKLLAEDYVLKENQLHLPHSAKIFFWKEIGKLMD